MSSLILKMLLKSIKARQTHNVIGITQLSSTLTRKKKINLAPIIGNFDLVFYRASTLKNKDSAQQNHVLVYATQKNKNVLVNNQIVEFERICFAFSPSVPIQLYVFNVASESLFVFISGKANDTSSGHPINLILVLSR